MPEPAQDHGKGALARRLWLGALVLLLAVLKLAYSAAWSFPAGADGGYYTNIVQNLLAGHGLVTDVSLYHRAFREFPHADSIYPLWPLTYAAFAGIFPLEKVAVWLPTALYFCSLGAAYLWARRLWPDDLFRRVPGLQAGHVLVLVLGLQTAYFLHTSRPYTEGLAYTLLFLWLWRVIPLLTRPGFKGGVESGAWLGLLLLVRSQFVLVVAALGLTLMIGAALQRERRRELLLHGAGLAVGGVATLLPYLVYVATQTGMFSVGNYILFNETPADSPLSQLQPYERPEGLAHLRVLAHGVATAFAWSVKVSYRGSYHLFHYALPVAALLGLLSILGAGPPRELRARARALAWLREPGNTRRVLCALLAVLGFLSVQLLVKSHDRWYFHRRHNLVALPLFYFALMALLRSRRLPVALLGGALLLGTAYLGVRRIAFEVYKAHRVTRVPPKASVVEWLRAEQARLGRPLIVAARSPQVMVWQLKDVHFHEVNLEATTLDDVLILFDQLGVDYLISAEREGVRHREPRARFQAELEELTEVELGGPRVYRRRLATGAADVRTLPPAFVGKGDMPDDADEP